MRRHAGLTGLVVAVLVAAAVACAPAAEDSAAVGQLSEAEQAPAMSWREVDPPVGAFSMAPNLVTAGEAVYASWLERFESSSGEVRHRLNMARLAAEGWNAPTTIAEGGDFFANWADLPAVAVAEDGTLYAHWLAKTDEETYAYSIFLARSINGGETWSQLGRLNDDDTPTEHGFVTYTPEGDSVRAFWLDGREMVDEKPMSLRTAAVGETVGPAEVLEDRVCECCSTDAALSAQGPVLVFRDRSDEEIRDIGVIRRERESWTKTNTVYADNWKIPGCPVNGPAIAAAGDSLVVVWYTAGGDQPRVQVAFSADAGASFQAARVIDDLARRRRCRGGDLVPTSLARRSQRGLDSCRPHDGGESRRISASGADPGSPLPCVGRDRR
jgi:hypothetical protein